MIVLKEKLTNKLSRKNEKKTFSPNSILRIVFGKGLGKGEKQSTDFVTIGGVYIDATPTCNSGETTSEEMKPKSYQSLDSIKTESSSDSICWTTSGSPCHNQGAPRIAKKFNVSRINPQNTYLSDSEMACRISIASRSLPRNNGYFVGNHVMINYERYMRTIAPMNRISVLDEIARLHAKAMAEKGELFHSHAEELYETLLGYDTSLSRIGENVVKGSDLTTIHKNITRKSISDLNNLLDRRFIAMGVGTAKGTDGSLYLCQIFHD